MFLKNCRASSTDISNDGTGQAASPTATNGCLWNASILQTPLDYYEKAYTGLEYGMEKYYPTWKIEEDHPVIQTGVKSYKELFKQEPLVDKWTFSTNGVAINGLHKIPVIGFGPGVEELAHAPNEKVPIDHLVKASAFYAMFVNNF